MIQSLGPNDRSVNHVKGLRKGFSLVELLAVMTIAFAVLMVVYSMLNGIMRTIAVSGSQTSQYQRLFEAADVFRHFAHQADTVIVTKDGQSLELSLAAMDDRSREAKLQLKANPLRLELEAEGMPRRVLGLNGFSKAQFQESQMPEGRRKMVVLELWPKVQMKGFSSQATDSAKSIRIESAIGLFSGSTASAEQPKP
ncbi:MAG: hypothetical protein RJA81_1887 [Planctomycetota bacterium]|jgi:prepilin-type N-terminal cleavage/methylation domain-containing protein